MNFFVANKKKRAKQGKWDNIPETPKDEPVEGAERSSSDDDADPSRFDNRLLTAIENLDIPRGESLLLMAALRDGLQKGRSVCMLFKDPITFFLTSFVLGSRTIRH